MSKLKQEFHLLIDEINNERALKSFYEIMKTLRHNDESKDVWDLLSEEQKSDLERIWEETDDDANLTPHNLVMEEARSWGKREGTK